MWVLLFVVFWFGFAFGFCFVSCSLCILACLSSFTDWCIAHKQQSREQKKSFHLSCADYVSLISHVSPAAKGFVVVVVFWFGFCVWCLFGLCVCFPVFGCLVCFLFPFASLHALALSLTGAQRTDSSSASKKKTGCCVINMAGHLLQVAPRGTWDAHALAVAYADFRPQHIRWTLPP